MAIREAVIVNEQECKFLIEATVHYLKTNDKKYSRLTKEEIYLLLKNMGASNTVINGCKW